MTILLYLQQFFFLKKIILNSFQGNCFIFFIIVIIA